MTATVAAIHIYPVKSCRAVALDSVEVAGTGLAGDRLFQVVDADVKSLLGVPVEASDSGDEAATWFSDLLGVGMDRFRPNVTVDTDEAWVEDTWRDFSIGAAVAVGDEVSVHETSDSVVPAPS